jgi:hypothetical protein
VIGSCLNNGRGLLPIDDYGMFGAPLAANTNRYFRTNARVAVGVLSFEGEGSKWRVQNPLSDQVNRGPDSVLRYEGCGEKCILRPLSRAAEATRGILPDKTSAKIRGILSTFATDGTASLFIRHKCPERLRLGGDS